MHISTKPEKIWTVLGSCLTIILFSPKSPLTAICHAQLPEQKGYENQCFDHCPQPCYNLLDDNQELKYISCSVKFMLDRLHREGIIDRELQAMIIGGAAVIKTSTDRFAIGEKNIEYAEGILKKLGIPVIHRDVGGTNSRQIILDTERRTVTLK